MPYYGDCPQCRRNEVNERVAFQKKMQAEQAYQNDRSDPTLRMALQRAESDLSSAQNDLANGHLRQMHTGR
jgi:hypothetical protein